jgi:hypothetical protein
MQFCGWWGGHSCGVEIGARGLAKIFMFSLAWCFRHKNINCLSVQCVCLFFLDIQTYRHCPMLDVEIRTFFQCRMQNAECRMQNAQCKIAPLA